jgi:predicted dehydrogenase
MAGTAGTNDPVCWGILSTANIGVKLVIPAIQTSQNGRVAAIASRDLAAAERLVAAQAPGARAYGSYEELLADPDIEAVYIPLPNALHAEWTIRAARAGKHVLCEKPLGATPEESIAMRDACRDAGVLLLEAFMYRFHPQIRWALEQAASGAIGRVRIVRSAFAFDLSDRGENIRLSASLAGGSLMDVGCYPLNFCRAVFGGAPQVVAARVDVPAESEVERTMAAVLDFGEGRFGVIDSSFALAWHQFAEIVGDEGRILLPRPFTPGTNETVVRLERDNESIERRFAEANHYRLEVEHFAECVRSGAPLAIAPEDAIEQAQVIEAIYAAAGYQRPW